MRRAPIAELKCGDSLHGDGTAIKRASVGRLDAMLSQAGSDGIRAIHVRLRPAARSFGRRFREGDALRLLGFTPRPECHFFPVGCFYGGCYYRVLGDEAPAEEIFDKVVGGLTSTVDLVAFGGHSRIPPCANAALSVGGGTGAGIYALWDDPADDEANRAWVRRIDDALAPYRAGRYVGEADLTAGPERLAECFTPEALERLRALRLTHDPGGLFFTWP